MEKIDIDVVEETVVKQTPPKEDGVSGTAFTIALGFIFLLGAVAVIYVMLSDRLNANDAYRVRELREQRDGLKSDCEENYKNLKINQEWIRQQTTINPELRPPLAVMVVKECRPTQPIEKPIDNK